MRCKNCGWPNPDGLVKCEKCNATLKGSMAGHSYHQSPSQKANSVNSSSNLRSTVREANVFGQQNPTNQGGENSTCRSCGYILASGTNVCPNCGEPVSKISSQQNAETPTNKNEKKCVKCGNSMPYGARFCPTCGQPTRQSTINSWDNPQNNDFCTLRPIRWSSEGDYEYRPITFSGKLITLNRANTDPNNQSITSKVQAVLTKEGGNWYIEDKSDMHSTMIRVSKKTKLEDGDIISLGNRLFEFKS